ncbi:MULTISPECIES: CBO0543 family protein [Bacillaceae]|uniref:CBO0543 family protein n=1 Tax=Bacillaceae TaxID=186817 RepID=UPI00296421C1|nr:CBO0543 family protein [Bacillus infantis]MDW2879696.1 CBO0543 family protein [Bacillus infantis]
MNQDQRNAIEQVNRSQEQAVQTFMDYWGQYSSWDTWQFWFHLLLIIIPLIVFWFVLDRKKAFRIGFFGFNVHVWFTYIDTMGVRYSFWFYPFQAIPQLPVSFGLDAALIPVIYMILYQWSLNKNLNYYLIFFY